MKSNKVFFSLILLLFIVIWIISVITHSDYDQPTKGRIIICFITAIAGLLIMRYTLPLYDFNTFIKLYIGAWFISGILYVPKLIVPLIYIAGHKFHTVIFSIYFSKVTFIFTPLPFIFYWVFLKAFGSSKDSQQQDN